MWSRLGLGIEMKIGTEQCNIAVGGMAVQEDLPLHCELVLTPEPSILSLKSVKWSNAASVAVNGSIRFAGTNSHRLTIIGLRGYFLYNLECRVPKKSFKESQDF